MARIDVEFTGRAKELLRRIMNDYPNLALVLDDATCCTVSNVFARSGGPPWAAERLPGNLGVPIYLHPSYERNLKTRRVTIDTLDFADDSLSLETNYGKRFVMISSTDIQR